MDVSVLSINFEHSSDNGSSIAAEWRWARGNNKNKNIYINPPSAHTPLHFYKILKHNKINAQKYEISNPFDFKYI